MQRDVYYARARNYPNAPGGRVVSRPRPAFGLREPDRVGPPPSAGGPSLLRGAAAEDAAERHPPLRHLRADPGRAASRHTWQQAVATVLAALEPLGSEYCGTLERGLRAAGAIATRIAASRAGPSARLLRRRSVHPHELSARRARPRLHPGPRGGPLDAQLSTRPGTSPTPITTTRSSWPKWPAPSTSNC